METLMKRTSSERMIVKRVSVPTGLEELMEGLTKEVLLKKPKDLYQFASDYFSKLVILRENSNKYKVHAVRSAQSITKVKAPIMPPFKHSSPQRPTNYLYRHINNRTIKSDEQKPDTISNKDRKKSTERNDANSNKTKQRNRSISSKRKSESSTSASSVQSTPREKRQPSVSKKVKSKPESNKNEREINKFAKNKGKDDNKKKKDKIIPAAIAATSTAAELLANEIINTKETINDDRNDSVSNSDANIIITPNTNIKGEIFESVTEDKPADVLKHDNTEKTANEIINTKETINDDRNDSVSNSDANIMTTPKTNVKGEISESVTEDKPADVLKHDNTEKKVNSDQNEEKTETTEETNDKIITSQSPTHPDLAHNFENEKEKLEYDIASSKTNKDDKLVSEEESLENCDAKNSNRLEDKAGEIKDSKEGNTANSLGSDQIKENLHEDITSVSDNVNLLEESNIDENVQEKKQESNCKMINKSLNTLEHGGKNEASINCDNLKNEDIIIKTVDDQTDNQSKEIDDEEKNDAKIFDSETSVDQKREATSEQRSDIEQLEKVSGISPSLNGESSAADESIKHDNEQTLPDIDQSKTKPNNESSSNMDNISFGLTKTYSEENTQSRESENTAAKSIQDFLTAEKCSFIEAVPTEETINNISEDIVDTREEHLSSEDDISAVPVKQSSKHILTESGDQKQIDSAPDASNDSKTPNQNLGSIKTSTLDVLASKINDDMDKQDKSKRSLGILSAVVAGATAVAVAPMVSSDEDQHTISDSDILANATNISISNNIHKIDEHIHSSDVAVKKVDHIAITEEHFNNMPKKSPVPDESPTDSDIWAKMTNIDQLSKTIMSMKDDCIKSETPGRLKNENETRSKDQKNTELYDKDNVKVLVADIDQIAKKLDAMSGLHLEQNTAAISTSDEVTKNILKSRMSEEEPGLIDNQVKLFLNWFINNEREHVFQIQSVDYDSPFHEKENSASRINKIETTEQLVEDKHVEETTNDQKHEIEASSKESEVKYYKHDDKCTDIQEATSAKRDGTETNALKADPITDKDNLIKEDASVEDSGQSSQRKTLSIDEQIKELCNDEKDDSVEDSGQSPQRKKRSIDEQIKDLFNDEKVNHSEAIVFEAESPKDKKLVNETTNNEDVEEDLNNIKENNTENNADENPISTTDIIKNITNSNLSSKNLGLIDDSVRNYLNSFIDKEQDHVYKDVRLSNDNNDTKQESVKEEKSVKSPSKIARYGNRARNETSPASKFLRRSSLSQIMTSSDEDQSPGKMKRAQSVGVMKLKQGDHKSKIPMSARQKLKDTPSRKSAGRRPLIRQMETNSKELEEKLSSRRGSEEVDKKKKNHEHDVPEKNSNKETKGDTNTVANVKEKEVIIEKDLKRKKPNVVEAENLKNLINTADNLIVNKSNEIVEKNFKENKNIETNSINSMNEQHGDINNEKALYDNSEQIQKKEEDENNAKLIQNNIDSELTLIPDEIIQDLHDKTQENKENEAIKDELTKDDTKNDSAKKITAENVDSTSMSLVDEETYKKVDENKTETTIDEHIKEEANENEQNKYAEEDENKIQPTDIEEDEAEIPHSNQALTKNGTDEDVDGESSSIVNDDLGNQKEYKNESDTKINIELENILSDNQQKLEQNENDSVKSEKEIAENVEVKSNHKVKVDEENIQDEVMNKSSAILVPSASNIENNDMKKKEESECELEKNDKIIKNDIEHNSVDDVTLETMEDEKNYEVKTYSGITNTSENSDGTHTISDSSKNIESDAKTGSKVELVDDITSKGIVSEANDNKEHKVDEDIINSSEQIISAEDNDKKDPEEHTHKSMESHGAIIGNAENKNTEEMKILSVDKVIPQLTEEYLTQNNKNDEENDIDKDINKGANVTLTIPLDKRNKVDDQNKQNEKYNEPVKHNEDTKDNVQIINEVDDEMKHNNREDETIVEEDLNKITVTSSEATPSGKIENEESDYQKKQNENKSEILEIKNNLEVEHTKDEEPKLVKEIVSNTIEDEMSNYNMEDKHNADHKDLNKLVSLTKVSSLDETENIQNQNPIKQEENENELVKFTENINGNNENKIIGDNKINLGDSILSQGIDEEIQKENDEDKDLNNATSITGLNSVNKPEDVQIDDAKEQKEKESETELLKNNDEVQNIIEVENADVKVKSSPEISPEATGHKVSDNKEDKNNEIDENINKSPVETITNSTDKENNAQSVDPKEEEEENESGSLQRNEAMQNHEHIQDDKDNTIDEKLKTIENEVNNKPVDAQVDDQKEQEENEIEFLKSSDKDKNIIEIENPDVKIKSFDKISSETKGSEVINDNKDGNQHEIDENLNKSSTKIITNAVDTFIHSQSGDPKEDAENKSQSFQYNKEIKNDENLKDDKRNSTDEKTETVENELNIYYNEHKENELDENVKKTDEIILTAPLNKVDNTQSNYGDTLEKEIHASIKSNEEINDNVGTENRREEVDLVDQSASKIRDGKINEEKKEHQIEDNEVREDIPKINYLNQKDNIQSNDQKKEENETGAVKNTEEIKDNNQDENLGKVNVKSIEEGVSINIEDELKKPNNEDKENELDEQINNDTNHVKQNQANLTITSPLDNPNKEQDMNHEERTNKSVENAEVIENSVEVEEISRNIENELKKPNNEGKENEVDEQINNDTNHVKQNQANLTIKFPLDNPNKEQDMNHEERNNKSVENAEVIENIVEAKSAPELSSKKSKDKENEEVEDANKTVDVTAISSEIDGVTSKNTTEEMNENERDKENNVEDTTLLSVMTVTTPVDKQNDSQCSDHEKQDEMSVEAANEIKDNNIGSEEIEGKSTSLDEPGNILSDNQEEIENVDTPAVNKNESNSQRTDDIKANPIDVISKPTEDNESITNKKSEESNTIDDVLDDKKKQDTEIGNKVDEEVHSENKKDIADREINDNKEYINDTANKTLITSTDKQEETKSKPVGINGVTETEANISDNVKENLVEGEASKKTGDNMYKDVIGQGNIQNKNQEEIQTTEHEANKDTHQKQQEDYKSKEESETDTKHLDIAEEAETKINEEEHGNIIVDGDIITNKSQDKKEDTQNDNQTEKEEKVNNEEITENKGTDQDECAEKMDEEQNMKRHKREIGDSRISDEEDDLQNNKEITENKGIGQDECVEKKDEEKNIEWHKHEIEDGKISGEKDDGVLQKEIKDSYTNIEKHYNEQNESKNTKINLNTEKINKEERAAMKLQSSWREYISRKNLKSMKNKSKNSTMTTKEAIIKIQAFVRGYLERQRHNRILNEENENPKTRIPNLYRSNTVVEPVINKKVVSQLNTLEHSVDEPLQAAEKDDNNNNQKKEETDLERDVRSAVNKVVRGYDDRHLTTPLEREVSTAIRHIMDSNDDDTTSHSIDENVDNVTEAIKQLPSVPSHDIPKAISEIPKTSHSETSQYNSNLTKEEDVDKDSGKLQFMVKKDTEKSQEDITDSEDIKTLASSLDDSTRNNIFPDIDVKMSRKNISNEKKAESIDLSESSKTSSDIAKSDSMEKLNKSGIETDSSTENLHPDEINDENKPVDHLKTNLSNENEINQPDINASELFSENHMKICESIPEENFRNEEVDKTETEEVKNDIENVSKDQTEATETTNDNKSEVDEIEALKQNNDDRKVELDEKQNAFKSEHSTSTNASSLINQTPGNESNSVTVDEVNHEGDAQTDKSGVKEDAATDDFSSVDSADSVVTVVEKPKEGNEQANTKTTVSQKSTDPLEDHVDLIDHVQNTLLDQICGKSVDRTNKFDLEHLRQELHEASSLYHENESTQTAHNDELLQYLNDFEPEDNRFDQKVIRSPNRELPDIEEEGESESKESDGNTEGVRFCGTSRACSSMSNKNSVGDLVEVMNFNDKKEISGDKTTAMSQMTEQSIPSLEADDLNKKELVSGGEGVSKLKHTSEFHDTVVVPLRVGPDVKDAVPGSTSTPEPMVEQRPESTDRGNQTAFQQVPAGAENLIGQRGCSSDADDDDGDDGAQASLKPSILQRFDDVSRQSISRNGQQDMENENNNKRNNAVSNVNNRNMEAEAATKIQAGFRGYQVRKQLKAKKTGADPKRSLRRKGSSEQKKDTDLEEKSAVKIQAGVRGFLVRRRQKKQINSSASA